MTMRPFSLNNVDKSWQNIIQQALSQVDPNYLNPLYKSTDWLPGHENIFNAFSQPLNNIHYVLFGESPYPRKESANGYAFWDAAITDLWSDTGLSKKVNRATSMRHILKMLLVAEGLLSPHATTQPDIAKLNKSALIQTNEAFFNNLHRHGFLLLNTTLVLQSGSPQKDADAWQPFMRVILEHLIQIKSKLTFILLGKIAQNSNIIKDHPDLNSLSAEHPYNLSFINNLTVQNFFKPLHLLIP